MRPIRSILAAVALLSATASTALAADFEVISSGMSNVSFTSDATLETITGTTTSIGGRISVDLADAASAKGSITIDVASLKTGIDMRDEHMRGADWLDAAGHPQIRFDLTAVDVKKGTALEHGKPVKATVSGDLTIKGVKKAIKVPAEVVFFKLEGKEVAGTYGLTSNVLRISTKFDVQLSDYGINVPAPLQTKVSNTLSLNIKLTAGEK